ncbi:unnamed protein product [Didymodactylos carnosus]|uniref:Uncharacterized protein n=2 Tax=Didymodactylos carnosus TaxID=1234261 RepID=A0A8S2RH56_9BILA|nr:unnamed protein product [Didymodactylos carnosus]CAF4168080.1 unnamed protein product [Didymodactylos carnosus]
MARGEIHGQIRQVKNIDVAIVHRLNVAKGFKISLVRWHHQLSTACVKGRITTKDDTETLDEIQARQKTEGQANVNRQEYVPTTTHKPEIKKSTTLNVSEEIWELAGQLSSNKTPSELNLSSKKLSDNEIEVICDKLKTNQSLKELDLSYNISDTSALLLSNALKTNRNLVRLNLSFNQISDEGVRSLSDALKQNHCLTILNLSSNQIGDDGVQLLSNALKENHSLMELNLSSNRITDAGARSLSNALKVNRNLTILHLSTNIIGDDGALSLSDALKQNQSLIKFYLSFNQIGDAGGRSLTKSNEKPNQNRVDDVLRNTIDQYDILHTLPFADYILALSVPDQLLARVLSTGISIKGDGMFLSYTGVRTSDQGKTWLVNGVDISISNPNYNVATTEYARANTEFNNANVPILQQVNVTQTQSLINYLNTKYAPC